MKLKKVKKEFFTGSGPTAEVELSCTLSISRKGNDGSFRSITARVGERLPCDLDKLEDAHDAAWDGCRKDLKKRFKQMATVAQSMEDETE